MKNRLFISVFLLLAVYSLSFAQAPTQSNTVAEPQQQIKKLAELNLALDALDRQLNNINAQKKVLENERASVVAIIAREQNEGAFKSSPGYPVVRVTGEQSVDLLINGHVQAVYLAGVHVRLVYTEDAVKFLKRELLQGIAYVRCVNSVCTEAQLYSKKDGSSLNCQLIESGMAMRLQGSVLDCSNSQITTIRTEAENDADRSGTSTGTYSGSGKSTPGKEVQVKGYTRKDGTYVKPHTRSAPRRKN